MPAEPGPGKSPRRSSPSTNGETEGAPPASTGETTGEHPGLPLATPQMGGVGQHPPDGETEVPVQEGDVPLSENEVRPPADLSGPEPTAAGWDGPDTGYWSMEADSGGDSYDSHDELEGDAWAHEEAAEATWYGQDDYEGSYDTTYQTPIEQDFATWHESSVPPGVGPRELRAPRELSPRPPSSGPWPELAMVTAVAVIIAAVILAITSANHPAHSPQGAPTTPIATGTPARSSPTTATARTTTTQPTTTTVKKPSQPKAQNLIVSPAIKHELVKSWLATNPGGVGLVAKDVAGTVPGAVYYGKQAGSPLVYWAIAAFQPSAVLVAEKSTAAGQDALAQFQNSDYVFSSKGGPSWTLLGYVSGGQCPGTYVPSAVLRVWGLCGL